MFPSLRARCDAVRREQQLFFAAILAPETIREVFGEASQVLDSARIYTTAVTVWTFLAQVLSANHGCVDAVLRLIAFRVARGQPACSARTGAYCLARDQLDEAAMHRLVTHTGQQIEETVPDEWRWHGRRVVVADGTTLTMADTPANQQEYPQLETQQPGCGSPIMRCVVLFALASGTVLDAAWGRYAGKQTAEVCLFRKTEKLLQAGDVLLADRAYSGWFELAGVVQRGVHVVVRKHASRPTDFRTGVRYGQDDHSVQWQKPKRPPEMSAEEYASYPEFLTLREIRIRVRTPGFRTREILVVTSLSDDLEFSREALADLFRRRWHAELNLRSLKSVLQMDHLRCLRPHRVRNELRAHLLAYNLIRQVMCETALREQTTPERVSFKGAVTALLELLPLLGVADRGIDVCDLLLDSCAAYGVGNRPDRSEPRMVKRRPKPYKRLMKPRHKYHPPAAA